MRWTKEAEELVSRVPFFVRRRVRKRVEDEANRSGAQEVTQEHVDSCKRKFLKNMDPEVKGHQVETCFGPSGCPNRAVADDGLAEQLEDLLIGKNLRNFLKERVRGPLKMHHEFRVSVSDCPNACSRPQIVDMGLIAGIRPRVSEEPCSGCGECVQVCREDAVMLTDHLDQPVIDYGKCVLCGQCVNACPTGTIEKDVEGYRVLIGGKLGRHPQLATELDGLYSKTDALKLVERCLEHYMGQNRNGERFGVILNRTGIRFLEKETDQSQNRSVRS